MKRVLCLVLAIAMCMSFAACKNSSQKTENKPTGDSAVHTVKVMNENNSPLSGVGVYIYEDSTKKELVWYDNTNDSGEMTFEDLQRDTYVAVLADVPVGYVVEEYYPLTGLSTEIRLVAGTMTGEEDIVYNLGDMVMDFSVTDTDGNVWSLNELLKTKDAVVLNFYYNGCEPCKMEFPHLQEASLDYADSVAVIALNPVDDEAAVAAFKAEHGLTFPMAAVNPNWANIMQVQAYPKTVVIDRFGNIVLMHTGSVDSAQQFRDVFAAVSGEDYQQVIFQNLSEVPVSAAEGTIDNPGFMGATPKFELTIPGNQEHYIEFLKLNNLTLRIADPDIYVIYNNKTYTPENGVLSLLVDCPDMNTSVLIGFGNGSTETKTFTITMTAQPGSLDNPYTLKEGDNKVKISAGNEQGVYYIWTAKENGSLKAWCINSTAGVKYDCTLYNLTSYAQRSLSADAQSGDDAQQYVEVLVNKGDKVQMIAAVLPDDSWNYPAGTFIYMVEFIPGAGRDKDKVDETEYTITVTDDQQQPIGNVSFSTVIKQEGQEDQVKTFSTNAEGIAAVMLPTGEYVVSYILPDGYVSEITEITLTKEAPEYTLVLTKKVIVMVDYTVTVTDPSGEPVVGATVIIGDKFAVTDQNGQATINLEEGEYTVQVSAPEGYVIPQDSYSFPEGETALLVDAEYISGSEKNPIDLTNDLLYEDDFAATVTVPAGQTVYFCAFRVSGMEMTINGGDPVTCGGSMVYPHTFTITNDGTADAEYTIAISFPLGSDMNPVVLENLGNLETNLEANDADGYYYRWTAKEEGFVAFYIASITDGVTGDIVLTNNTNSTVRSLREDGQGNLVTLNVAAGDEVSICVTAGADSPAADILSVGSFTAQENTEDVKVPYSVVVKDENGEPMEGIAVTIGNSQLVTDANGLAFVQLVEGTYTATVSVPEGYKAQWSQFSLSVIEPQANAVLTQLKELEYTVNVQLNSTAYTGSVQVQILQGASVVYEATTTSGTVTAQLLEGDYTVKLTLDSNLYGYDAATAVLSASNTKLTIALQKLTTYTDYTVTVADYNGNVYSGIFVQIMKGTQVMASGTTDADGKFAKKLETGDYTVKLTFSGTSYYYNTNTAVLTGVAPNLTIRLADEVDPEKVMSHWFINENDMYVLDEGSTHIQVSASKPYFTTEMGYNDCLFVFEPTQTGMFRISVDQPGVELRNYGSSPYFLFIADSSSKHEDGALPFELMRNEQVGNVFMFLGVETLEGVTDLCITITRVGEPGFDISAQPWSTEWQTGYTPVQQTVSVPSGKTLTYVDITAATSAYNIVYSAADGFYHVGSETGPVLYLNLGTVTKQNISLNTIINGDGLGGGASIRRYFYDTTGAFIKKEDYTDVLLGYIAKADTKYGLYPVTEELAYILQNAKPGWWDATSPDYLLEGCNPDLGWLFACCYIK